jgi:hypothetical protein
VTVSDVPADYADRLTELSPGHFSRLRLLALDVRDLVLAKRVRNGPVALEDAKFLAEKGRLDETVLAMPRAGSAALLTFYVLAQMLRASLGRGLLAV